MKKLLDRGLWYWDDDFPEDPEDSSGMGSADEGIKISTQLKKTHATYNVLTNMIIYVCMKMQKYA